MLKERRIRVVANAAAGSIPKPVAKRFWKSPRRQGIGVRVATVAGDDIMDQLDALLARGVETQEHGNR